jgi:origin recognition complex subunit 5
MCNDTDIIDIIKTLTSPSSSSPASHPLYSRFLDLILSTLLPLTSLPSEIEYLSQTLWPIYTSSLPPHSEQSLLNRPYPDPANIPPPLAITVKLLTDLKHQLSIPLTAAIESVLTRQIGRREFEKAMLPSRAEPGMGMMMGGVRRGIPKAPGLELPVVAKYLLVAGYCASYNPAKSDMRLFGRGTGPDRRTKKGGGTRRAGYGRVRIGKVSLVAIMSILTL